MINNSRSKDNKNRYKTNNSNNDFQRDKIKMKDVKLTTDDRLIVNPQRANSLRQTERARLNTERDDNSSDNAPQNRAENNNNISEGFTHKSPNNNKNHWKNHKDKRNNNHPKPRAESSTANVKGTVTTGAAEAKPAANPEQVNIEAKPAAKTEPKAKININAKPEIKTEPKAKININAKPEIKAEPKADINIEAKPAASPEPQSNQRSRTNNYWRNRKAQKAAKAAENAAKNGNISENTAAADTSEENSKKPLNTTELNTINENSSEISGKPQIEAPALKDNSFQQKSNVNHQNHNKKISSELSKEIKSSERSVSAVEEEPLNKALPIEKKVENPAVTRNIKTQEKFIRSSDKKKPGIIDSEKTVEGSSKPAQPIPANKNNTTEKVEESFPAAAEEVKPPAKSKNRGKKKKSKAQVIEQPKEIQEPIIKNESDNTNTISKNTQSIEKAAEPKELNENKVQQNTNAARTQNQKKSNRRNNNKRFKKTEELSVNKDVLSIINRQIDEVLEEEKLILEALESSIEFFDNTIEIPEFAETEAIIESADEPEGTEGLQSKKKKGKPNKRKLERNAVIPLDIEEINPAIYEKNYIKTTFPEDTSETAGKYSLIKREDMQYSKIIPRMLFDRDLPSNKSLSEFVDKVGKVLTDDMLLVEGAKVIIGVSGGVDSIVLLDVFSQLAEKLRLSISIAHFNHNLRGISSDKDEELVRKIAEKYGIKVYTGNENIMAYASSNSISIEQAARIRRYKMFERLAGNLKADFVALAHTCDDSAETFLLNLIRGTGLTGLTGIPPKRLLTKSSHIVRPLIAVSKNEIIDYANKRNLVWREDESNSLTLYTRNKIRLDLIPKLKEEFSPAIIDMINRTAKILKGADDFINMYVNELLQQLIKERRKDRFIINIPQLQTFSDFIQGEILQTSVSKVFKVLPISQNMIERILALCESPTGSICELNKTLYVLKDRTNLVFALKNAIPEVNQQIEKEDEINNQYFSLKLSYVTRKDVEYSKDPNVEYFDAELLPTFLQVRNWEDGDNFQPLGMEGTVKVSDFLTNIKIPVIDKKNILVLATKTDIIWLIGKRISNKYKITNSTKKVLKAVFVKKNTDKK